MTGTNLKIVCGKLADDKDPGSSPLSHVDPVHRARPYIDEIIAWLPENRRHVLTPLRSIWRNLKVVEVETSFEFKDDRTYVNSSTICEFLSSRVVPVLGMNLPGVPLDARFHRLVVNNGIMHCQQMRNDSGSISQAACEFRLGSGYEVFYVYFFEGEAPVLHRIASNYVIQDLKLLSPYSGSCQIMVSDTRSLLENTIEANKRLHQNTFPQKEFKVINLYMKRFPLGFVPKRKGKYALEIRHVGSRSHKDGLATLNSFSFPELDIPDFEMCYLLLGVKT